MNLDDSGKGKFYLEKDGKQLGSMKIAIEEGELKVYHTEVLPEMEGKGLAKQIMNRMVEYAREKKYSVLPLCPYVRLQFGRKENDYKDIWIDRSEY